jgi:hypothetical protein
LYLPGRARYFGCRHCHDLTYQSAQEHDKRVDALRKNPAEVEAILERGKENLLSAKVLLAIKAIRTWP